jgi:hypothetical protein
MAAYTMFSFSVAWQDVSRDNVLNSDVSASNSETMFTDETREAILSNIYWESPNSYACGIYLFVLNWLKP